MDRGSMVVFGLKTILWLGVVAISLLSILDKIPEWLILFPAAPIAFSAIRRIIKARSGN